MQQPAVEHEMWNRRARHGDEAVAHESKFSKMDLCSVGSFPAAAGFILTVIRALQKRSNLPTNERGGCLFDENFL